MNNGKEIKVMHIAQAAGGVERYIQMLLKYLDKSKIENILVCSFDYQTDQFSGLVDKIEQFDMKREIGINDFKAAWKIRKIIKKYNPDIVYAHSSKAGAIVRIANIGLKSKCIYNPHGWAFNMRGSKIKQLIYAIIEKIMVPFCDRIICISDYEKKSAIDMNICNENKIKVIVNGIDIKKYEEKERGILRREKIGIPEDAFVIGMVGRISPQKAPDVFIRVAEKIKNVIPNSYLMIVGDGEHRDEIQQYAKEYGFEDKLLITGWVDNSMDYVELFDVAMLISRWEGFGLVLPEYMLSEKPIIATKVDAIPNIIKDNENGILVEVDKVEEIFNAVLEICENRALADKFIKNGLKDVYNFFDVERVAMEHQCMFQEMRRINY